MQPLVQVPSGLSSFYIGLLVVDVRSQPWKVLESSLAATVNAGTVSDNRWI